jgi:hypothetical protein
MNVKISYMTNNCLNYSYCGLGHFATVYKLFSTTNINEDTVLVEFYKTE